MILAALVLTVGAQMSAERAISATRAFIKDYKLPGKYSLLSCSPPGTWSPEDKLWHVDFVRSPSSKYEFQVNEKGRVIGMFRSGMERVMPIRTPEWKAKADDRAEQILKQFHPEFPYNPPDPYFARFGENAHVFMVTKNGLPFVGRILAYSVTIEGPTWEMTCFGAPDSLPSVNAKSPKITSKVAEQSAERSIRATDYKPFKLNSLKLGPPRLVYYAGETAPEARLAWYFKAMISIDRGRGYSGGEEGIVIDALTGERIKTPYRLP